MLMGISIFHTAALQSSSVKVAYRPQLIRHWSSPAEIFVLGILRVTIFILIHSFSCTQIHKDIDGPFSKSRYSGQLHVEIGFSVKRVFVLPTSRGFQRPWGNIRWELRSFSPTLRQPGRRLMARVFAANWHLRDRRDTYSPNHITIILRGGGSRLGRRQYLWLPMYSQMQRAAQQEGEANR